MLSNCASLYSNFVQYHKLLANLPMTFLLKQRADFLRRSPVPGVSRLRRPLPGTDPERRGRLRRPAENEHAQQRPIPRIRILLHMEPQGKINLSLYSHLFRRVYHVFYKLYHDFQLDSNSAADRLDVNIARGAFAIAGDVNANCLGGECLHIRGMLS